MNRLPISRRAYILRLLSEGMSMRATARLADCSLNTVTHLLVDAGNACADYLDKTLRGLPCKRIECDEIWCFCGCKQKNATPEKQGRGEGDVWTWLALCSDSKMIVSWHVGSRDIWDARHFMEDLHSRLNNRIQLSTDGAVPYPDAVERAFGSEIDYGMVIKDFGHKTPKERPDTKYSQPTIRGIRKVRVKGRPDKAKISTSFIERANLTVRMTNRRFTRLTNAFSKKLVNLRHSVALNTLFYNFVRIHKTLRVTPAMELGLTDHVWDFEEVVALIQSN